MIKDEEKFLDEIARDWGETSDFCVGGVEKTLNSSLHWHVFTLGIFRTKVLEHSEWKVEFYSIFFMLEEKQEKKMFKYLKFAAAVGLKLLDFVSFAGSQHWNILFRMIARIRSVYFIFC